MERIKKFWNSGIIGKIVIIATPLILICCACGGLSLILPPTAKTTEQAEQAKSTAQPVEQDATAAATLPPADTSTPKPTATATEAPLGITRDHPYPAGAVVDIGNSMQLSIVAVTRPANDVVSNGNMFNETPQPNIEYALVRIHVQCTKSTNDKCSFSAFQLKTVGIDGTIRDIPFVAGIPEEMEMSVEFFGGSSIEGNLAFLVPAGDATAVLIYEPILFGDPVYIALQ